MEARVCECYKVVNQETERLFPAGDFHALWRGAVGVGLSLRPG
jgi:hypothetical protein